MTPSFAPAADKDQLAKDPEVARIMSAWVVNFVRFTAWPPEAFENDKSPIVIAVVGTDEVGKSLAAIGAGVTISNRAVNVRHFTVPSSEGTPEEQEAAQKQFYATLRRCHLLYIAESESERMAPLLEKVAGARLLTVSAIKGFAAAGGALGFDVRNNRVVFDANLEAIDASGVRVSSKILRLARIQKTEKK